MKIFAIGDLHLSFGETVEKPMDIFGGQWIGHTEKLYKSWHEKISDEDIVIICGDISWGLKLEEAKADLGFTAFRAASCFSGEITICGGNLSESSMSFMMTGPWNLSRTDALWRRYPARAQARLQCAAQEAGSVPELRALHSTTAKFTSGRRQG